MEERRAKVAESYKLYQERFKATYYQNCSFEFENLEAPHLHLAVCASQAVIGYGNNKILFWTDKNTEVIENPHQGSLESIAISHSGQYVASGSSDKSIKIFKDKKEFKHHAGAHNGTVTALAFSPDETYLASGSDDKTIKIWSPDGQSQVQELGSHHKDKVESLSFTSDHKLVSGSHDGVIIVWNLADKPVTIVYQYQSHKGPVKSISAALKQNVFATCGSEDGFVNIFNTTKHEPVISNKDPLKNQAVHSVSINSEGKQVIMADFLKQTAILWNLETTKIEDGMKTFQIAETPLNGFSFTDDLHFISLTRDQKLKKWNLDGTGEEYDLPSDIVKEPSDMPYEKIVTHLVPISSTKKNFIVENKTKILCQENERIIFEAPLTEPVSYISANNTGDIFVTASANKISLWDISRHTPVKYLDRVFDDEISALSISKDGKFVIAGSVGSKSKLWHLKKNHFEKMERYDSLPKFGRVQATFLISKMEKDDKQMKHYLIVVYINKALTIWNIESKKQVISWEDDIPGDIYSADICENGKYIVCGSENMIKIWNFTTQKIEIRIPNPHLGRINLISAGNLYFVSSGVQDKSMKLWSFQDYSEVHHYTNLHADAVTAVHLNEGGNIIQTASLDGTINSWGVDSKNFLGSRRELKRPIITAIVVSEVSDEVVCSYSDGQIAKWSLDKYNLVSRYKAHSSWILSLAATGDFKILASGDISHKIKIWNNTNHLLLHQLADGAEVGYITSLAFSQDFKTLMSTAVDAYHNFSITYWEVGNYHKIKDVSLDSKRPITSLALNKLNGKYTISGPAHTAIFVNDGESNKTLHEFKKEKEYDIKTLSISSSCEDAVYSTSDKKVFYWRLGDKPEKPVLQYEHPDVNSIFNLSISSNGKYIASYGTENGKILIWDRLNKRIEHEFYAIPYKAVICSKISHDERFIVVASSDRSLTFFDGRKKANYQMLYRIEKAHDDYITSIDISLDNTVLVTTSKDKSVKLWDIRTKDLIHHYQNAFDCTVDSASISPNKDKVIATGFKSQKIQLWNIGKDFNLAHTLDTGHKGNVRAAFYSKDGKILVSYGQTDRSIKLWDTNTWETKYVFGSQHTDQITCVAMTDDYETVVSGSLDKNIIVWNTTKKGFFKFANAHAAGVQSVAITGKLKYIVSGSRDKEMKLWGMKANQRYCIHVFANEKLPPHLGPVRSLSISTSGTYIVSSGSIDSKMRIWIAENPQLETTERKLTNPVTAIALANEAGKILTVSHNELVTYPLLETKPDTTYKKDQHSEPITAAAISADSNTVISVSADKSMVMWVRQEPVCVKALAHDKPIQAVVLSRDIRIIITGSDDRSIKIWTIENNYRNFVLTQHFKNAHEDSVKALAISSNNKYAVSGSLDSTMKLWDIEGKRLVHHFKLAHGDAVNCVQISADNRFIVSGSSDKKLRIWNLYTEQLIHEFRAAHHDVIKAVAISPDSKLIASASADKTIKLWSFEALRLIHHYVVEQPHKNDMTESEEEKRNTKIRGHSADITSIGFSAENKYIVSASLDKTVKLWPIPALIALSDSFSIFFSLSPELHDDDIILPFMWNSMHLAALKNKLEFAKNMEGNQMKEPDFMGNLPIDYILTDTLEYNHYIEEKIRIIKEIRANSHKSFLKVMKAMRLEYINFLRKTSLSNPKLVKKFLALCVDEIDDKHIRQEEVASDLQLKIYGMPTEEFVESDKPIITSAIQEKLVMADPIRTYKLRYITTTMPLNLDLGSENIKALLIYLSEQSQRFIFEDKFVLFILSYLWKKTKPYQRFLFWLYTIFMILVSAEATNRDLDKNGLNYFIVIYSCFLMIFEIVQLSAQFMLDFWSFFDWTTHALVISTMIIFINDPLAPYLPYLRAVYFFSGYFRWLAYLRIFDGIRAIIRSIIEILKDMSSFLIILATTILCYTFILEGFNYDENKDFFKYMFDGYQYLYNSEIDGASVGLQALQVIFPFVINVVFLNMLITIMGDTFDRTQEKITYSDNVEKVEIILEIVYLVIKMRSIKNFIFKTIFSRKTYDIRKFFRYIKSLFYVKRSGKRISTEKRMKIANSFRRELNPTDASNKELEYIIKCDYKAEEETDDEWSGKLRHLLRKNIESIERGEEELETELGAKIMEISGGADQGGKDRIEKLETNVSSIQKDIEFMGEQLGKLYKIFETQIATEIKTNGIRAMEVNPSEINIKTKV